MNTSNNIVIDGYYNKLHQVQSLGITREEALRPAFFSLLEHYSHEAKWIVVAEERLSNGKRPDATLYDTFKIPRGFWEAKDTHDDLEKEIAGKLAIGYPTANTIFEDTRRAVLYQNKQRVFIADLNEPPQLVELLDRFFHHSDERIEEYHRAVAEFSKRIPDLAKGLTRVIQEQKKSNSLFANALEAFHDLCRTALNPQVKIEAIEEMLVQHLLTDRLFQNVFDNPEFLQRNVIAAEIEKVIAALTSKAFSKKAFLSSLDYFYQTIEETARTISDWSQKQAFLNDVYERFFQDFSRKTADTHGIVYTPQEIVDFMCQSVEDILQTEFGLSLAQEGVTVLDPCTGTGNFLVNILRRVGQAFPLDLTRKYDQELFANEVMLLPYYVASLNIEHAYYEMQGQYRPFPGVSFADTLDMAEMRLGLFGEENSQRVERQRATPITIIIGNPPYNVGQQNENDNNKNRGYQVIDHRVRDTYGKLSSATNKNALSDMYVKFFRWATDRLEGRDGIICFVSNNGFLKGIAFDGFRKSLTQEFNLIYHFDLKGNARTSGERRRAEGGNIFSDLIRTGIGITILVRKSNDGKCQFKYHPVEDYLPAYKKKIYLRSFESVSSIPWSYMEPDKKGNWITEGISTDFNTFLGIGSRDEKGSVTPQTIFHSYGRGVATSRDEWVYDFNKAKLTKEILSFIEAYNSEVDRWNLESNETTKVDNFVLYDDKKISWSRDLKSDLKRGRYIEYTEEKIRTSLYRPFSKRFLFFDRIANEEVYKMPSAYPDQTISNISINVTDIGSEKPFMLLISDSISDLHLVGAGSSAQCFPLHTYAIDNTIRRDNITDWALEKFQSAYGNSISRENIFYYVYAVLHHPEYRTRYAENLKRELPRIPLLGKDAENATTIFFALAEIGRELAKLHIDYETVAEYPLKQHVNTDVTFTWRVSKMKLSKDKTALAVNEALSFSGIPPEAFEYRLGNRSALEWIIDQYQVKTDKRTGLVSDPNRDEEPEYIARLVRRIVTVSLETQKLVAKIAEVPL